MNIKKISNLCPYTHLIKIMRTAYKEKRIPKSSRSGLLIAALGLFCPLFWIPFLSGVSLEELWFDILHSSLFICIGLFIFALGIYDEYKNN